MSAVDGTVGEPTFIPNPAPAERFAPPFNPEGFVGDGDPSLSHQPRTPGNPDGDIHGVPVMAINSVEAAEEIGLL